MQTTPLSYFAVALQNLMDERGMTQLQLEGLAAVSQSQISLYRKDEARPTREALGRLCLAFGDDSQALLIAYLRDAVPPELEKTVKILPATGHEKQHISSPSPAYSRLPKRIRSLIDSITAEAEQSPELLKLLESAVDLFKGR